MLLDSLRGSPKPPGVALALVGGDIVPLFEPLPANVTRELVEGVGIVFPHVPVQRSFLAAGEAADLTPGVKNARDEAQGELALLCSGLECAVN